MSTPSPSPTPRGIPFEFDPNYDPLPDTGYAPASPLAAPIDEFYMSSADVKRFMSYHHPIPAGRGFTRDFMHRKYPGWTWGQVMYVLKVSGIFSFQDRGLLPDYVGLVITRTEVFPDDGSLEHPVKTAYIATN